MTSVMSPSDLDTGIGQPRGIEDRVPRGHWNWFSESPSSSRRLGVGDPGENVQFPAQNQFGEASDVAEVSLHYVGVNGLVEVVGGQGHTQTDTDQTQDL